MTDPVDESFLDEYLDKPRPLRQGGLPQGYRMRHDAHYVDELESRRRPPEPSVPGLSFSTSIPVTFALRDLSQELEGVASCFGLVPPGTRPARERMGLALARVGVQRSMRAFQALRVLLEDPSPDPIQISLDDIVRQTMKDFDEELFVAQSRVSFEPGNAPIRLNADGKLLLIAVQACMGTLVSLVEASGRGGAIQIAARVSEGLAHCELRQDTYRVPADQFARLADLEWSERPGGIPAGIGLAAAARIAHAHGGLLDAQRTEAGGCLLRLALSHS